MVEVDLAVAAVGADLEFRSRLSRRLSTPVGELRLRARSTTSRQPFRRTETSVCLEAVLNKRLASAPIPELRSRGAAVSVRDEGVLDPWVAEWLEANAAMMEPPAKYTPEYLAAARADVPVPDPRCGEDHG